MEKLNKLGPYIRAGEINETGNAFLFQVQSPDANYYLAKVPKNLDAGSAAARQFNAIARHLKKIDNPYINKVIDAGSSDDTGIYFMILQEVKNAKTLEEFVEEEIEVNRFYLKYILQIWSNCAEALDLAASKNIYHKDLHPRNILIDHNDNPVIIDFGIAILEHTISKNPPQNEFSNKFSPPELIRKEENRLLSRTDFYSLSLCILYSLLGHKLFYEEENNKVRLEKVLSLYKPYISKVGLEALEIVFKKSFDNDPENRFFRYSELRDALNDLFHVINHTPEKPFAIWIPDDTYREQILNDINLSGFSISVNERRHHKFRNVTAKISTTNFLANTCFLSNKGNCLEIRDIKKIDNLEENELKSYKFVSNAGYQLNGVNFIHLAPDEVDDDYNYDVFNFLEKLFTDKKDTTKSSLSRTPRKILKDYKTLLDEEIAYLRTNAFRVRYSEVSIINPNEAGFKIVLDDNTSIDDVYNFLKRSKAAFRRGNELTLKASSDSQGKNNSLTIGFSTRFNSKDSNLFIKDFPFKQKDDIPQNGYLIEDTSIMEIQYKRQLYAIKSYERNEVTNPDLRKYLFQPSNLNTLARNTGNLITSLEILSTGDDGNPINFQEAQRDAILKSIYRPPITIIQGPPGTGK